MQSLDRLGVSDLIRGGSVDGGFGGGRAVPAAVADVRWAELPLTARTRRLSAVAVGLLAAVPVLFLFGSLLSRSGSAVRPDHGEHPDDRPGSEFATHALPDRTHGLGGGRPAARRVLARGLAPAGHVRARPAGPPGHRTHLPGRHRRAVRAVRRFPGEGTLPRPRRVPGADGDDHRGIRPGRLLRTGRRDDADASLAAGRGLAARPPRGRADSPAPAADGGRPRPARPAAGQRLQPDAALSLLLRPHRGPLLHARLHDLAGRSSSRGLPPRCCGGSARGSCPARCSPRWWRSWPSTSSIQTPSSPGSNLAARGRGRIAGQGVPGPTERRRDPRDRRRRHAAGGDRSGAPCYGRWKPGGVRNWSKSGPASTWNLARRKARGSVGPAWEAVRGCAPPVEGQGTDAKL